jgi:hypothetical protein
MPASHDIAASQSGLCAGKHVAVVVAAVAAGRPVAAARPPDTMEARRACHPASSRSSSSTRACRVRR